MYEREVFWIAELGTKAHNGYNLSDGGSGGLTGHTHTAEARARISAGNSGKTLSPETRAKIGAAHRGKKKSPEHVAKTAAAKLGTKHSEETKAKMRASHAARRTQLDAEGHARLV